ncbi:MAG: DUF721 domain-containing protein [Bryobacterales bacterium]|nr:DUF721 domain-containing protein [Bryobacterales bacterium]
MERASRTLGKLRFPEDSVSLEALARAAWPSVVGKIIASHTRASRMVRSRLIVEVEDQVWQRQLTQMSKHIASRMKDALGGAEIDEVEFRVSIRRREPGRATSSTTQGRAEDEADRIPDPVMRGIYLRARRKAMA